MSESEEKKTINPEDLPILTSQQNDFVRYYGVEGKTGAESYREAYNSRGNTATCCIEASRLLKNPNISLWLQYFRQVQREHLEQEIKYSVDDAFREFDDLKTIALESKDKNGNPNINGACKAVEMKVKLKGLLQDDAQVQNSIVVNMNDVEVDGIPLELKIGEDIDNARENK